MSDGFLQPVRLEPVRLKPVTLDPVLLNSYNDWLQERDGGVYYKGRFFTEDVVAMVGRWVLTEPGDTNIIPYSTDVSQWTGSGGATESAGTWTIPVSGEVRIGSGLTITAERWTAWLDIAAISGPLTLRVNDGTSNTDVPLTATGITENIAVLAAGSGYVAIRNDGVATQTVQPDHAQFEKGTRSSHIPTNGAPATRAATTETKRELTEKELGLLRGVPDGVELVIDGGFNTACGVNWNCGTGWSISGGRGVADGTQVSFESIRQFDTLSVGDVILATGDINVDAGGCRLQVDGAATNDTYHTATGRYTHIAVIDTAGVQSLGFRCNAEFEGTVDNVSFQKLTPIRTQISTQWVPGVSATISSPPLGILSFKTDRVGVIYHNSGSILLSYDGVNAATKAKSWIANTPYAISVRCGDETDMLNPAGNPLGGLAVGNWFQIGVDGVWGVPKVFTGHWPVDIDVDGKAWMYLAYGIPAFSMEIEPPTIEAL